jgi:hypothetical protein
MPTTSDVGTRIARQRRGAARFFWMWLIVATSMSVAGNVAHAVLHATTGTVAVVAAAALVIGKRRCQSRPNMPKQCGIGGWSLLENDVRNWIIAWNEDAKPFRWTKTADEILDSLAKYMARISGAIRFPRVYAGRDRGGGDHGERYVEGKVAFEGADLGAPDDGSQRQGGFEHGEVIADA